MSDPMRDYLEQRDHGDGGIVMDELDDNWLSIELEACTKEFDQWSGGLKQSFDALASTANHEPDSDVAAEE